MTGDSYDNPTGPEDNQNDPQPAGEPAEGPSAQEGPGASQGSGGAASGSTGGEVPPDKAWYYAVAGKSYGPVTEEQLTALARAGYFRKEDYVYAGYIGQWVRADSVHGLFDTVGPVDAGRPTPPGEVRVPGQATPVGAGVQYVEFAGFWIRVLAVFIDGIILSVPTWIVMFTIMGIAMADSSGVSRPGSPPPFLMFIQIPLMLVSTVFSWLYFAFMESSRWQATLGKRAVGIMVISLNGDRVTFARATGRYFASLLSGLICNIGYIMGAFTQKKQTLHDMIADTAVIYGKTS